MITILAVGKKHDPLLESAIAGYEKRLKAPFDISWQLLPHSSLQDDAARTEESARVLSRIPRDAYVILLDETGTQFTSPELAHACQEQFVHAKTPTFVIGGAYGVDASLHVRAELTLSLSRLVFPHQLVRLILTEQLYRAQEISRGSGYHHV